MQYLNN